MVETRSIQYRVDNSEDRNYNVVLVTGVLERDFIFSHTAAGEEYFESIIACKRQSGVEDYIPIVVSKRWKPSRFEKGQRVEVSGSFRSISRPGPDGKNHLILYVFSDFIEEAKNLQENEDDVNSIYLDGYVCKQPIYRTTPFGRKITDLLVAVHRGYGKSSYIPCIAWGNLAWWAETLQLGDQIALYGRIQSRVYHKTYPDGTEEKRTTVELSISQMNKLDR